MAAANNEPDADRKLIHEINRLLDEQDCMLQHERLGHAHAKREQRVRKEAEWQQQQQQQQFLEYLRQA
jgi:hypothetical protein